MRSIISKFLLFTFSLLLPISGMAVPEFTRPNALIPPDIPLKFSSSSETAILEWGCPVSEMVTASSGPDAIQKIQEECMEEVRRAATSKPGVFEVIDISIIWPDVSVSKEKEGYHLQGTFFLETLVLQGAE